LPCGVWRDQDIAGDACGQAIVRQFLYRDSCRLLQYDWGSNDSWLGIPVEWDEISGARVIVEAGFRDFRVTPSQGSHFFQNLTAFQIGYFTVNPDAGEGSLDWQWLNERSAIAEQGCVRHVRFTEPIRVVMNSRSSQGVIFKPEAL
jgi:hypothetical protein